MAEYIENGNALCLLGNLAKEPAYQHDGEDYYVGICEASGVINEIQPVDVAPVRHGRWVKMDTTGLLAVEPVWNCSSCGYPVGVSVAGSKYCPNCGAKMDLEG